MAINDHSSVRFENDRAGTWGNAHTKVVEVLSPARADELVTRYMRVEPGMQIHAVHAIVTGVTSGTWDFGYAIGEADNAASAAGTGDPNYFIAAGILAGVKTNVSSRAGTTATGSRPYLPAEPGYLTIQNKAAVSVATTRITVMVDFQYIGND